MANATILIKQAGSTNVRILPMQGQSITEGDYQIEIKKENAWTPIMVGVKKPIAEQIVQNALNRVILG